MNDPALLSMSLLDIKPFHGQTLKEIFSGYYDESITRANQQHNTLPSSLAQGLL